MTLILFSSDPQLKQLCRETLQCLGGQHYKLVQTDDLRVADDAQVYIADCSSNGMAPSLFRAVASKIRERTLWILDKGSVNDFEVQIGGPAWILLKPLTAVALGAALDGWMCSGNLEDAKNDKKGLLQRLIQANLKMQMYEQERVCAMERAAHEFRTPLSTSVGSCALLSGGTLGPLTDAQTEIVKRMGRSAMRMSKIAKELLEGQARPELGLLNAEDFADSVRQAIHETKAACKDIEIDVSLAPAFGSLRIDVFSLEQVLTNLIENASRFVPSRGRIQIRSYPNWESGCEQSGDLFRVEVQNNGPTIPDRFLESIFQESVSLPDPKGRKGHGLGLAICRSIMKRHGGSIWAENSSSGPMFCFTLPLVQSKFRERLLVSHASSC